jgi:hypothetical protein
MPDFGFVGPSYEAPSIYQDAQECINFRPEIDALKQPGQRGVVSLYPTPGLTLKALLTAQSEVRGLRTVSGGSYMVAVCGPYVYVLTSSLTASIIGQLNTSTGVVGITDNGQSVYIVDGAYRYTWRISTPATAIFTGSISGTTLTVTNVSSGTIGVGQSLFGIGVSNETIITALGTGSGGVGTYTINNSQTITARSMNSSAVAATFTGSISSGVNSVTITNQGTNYTNPIVTFGTLWTATTVVTTGQQIYYGSNLYTVSTGGITGSTAPTHTSGSAANGTSTLTYAGVVATATVTQVGGKITEVSMANRGSGYTTAPTVTFADSLGGSGSSATGTANLVANSLQVTSITGTLYLGQTIQGAGVTANTIITSFGTGTGGVGTYNLNYTQSVSSETMYALNWTILPSTDGAFSGGNTVGTYDNYFVYNRPDTQQFGSSDLLSPISNSLSFGSKDGSPDNLIALIIDHREIYLMGEASSEVWVDVGTVPFPFQRIPGTSTQHGCAAKFSLSRLGNSFAYVSRNSRGQGQIMQMDGYKPTRISTHAVEQSLVNQYIDDAIAWTYQLEGHECYVVTFPTLQLTWVFDATTQMWHKWLYLNNLGQYERHRGQCCAVFQGMVLVGDYSNGSIYELDPDNYTDNGQTIRRLRRAPHLVADLQRQYFDELQIQFQPGVGTTGLSTSATTTIPFATYLGDTYSIAPTQTLSIPYTSTFILGTSNIISTNTTTNPQAMLRWSNDGGSTWSTEHWASIGSIGRYKNRAIWRRLGMARDRIFEVSISDPVKAVIVSANLKASSGDN